jgi:hypothetical protein
MATNSTGIQYEMLYIDIVVNRVIVKTEINKEEAKGVSSNLVMKTSKG